VAGKTGQLQWLKLKENEDEELHSGDLSGKKGRADG